MRESTYLVSDTIISLLYPLSLSKLEHVETCIGCVSQSLNLISRLSTLALCTCKDTIRSDSNKIITLYISELIRIAFTPYILPSSNIVIDINNIT
jgi:hypothetical protein